MTAPGVVRVRCQAAALEAQVEGRGTMLHSQALRHWVETNVTRSPQLRVDLSRCDYMDSTFIGTLLGLKRLLEARPAGALVLVCPSAACVQLLAQMRIGQIFAVEDAPAADEGWQEVSVPHEALKTRAFQCNVVEAHQRLADCPGPTGDRFRQLAEDLSRELEQR